MISTACVSCEISEKKKRFNSLAFAFGVFGIACNLCLLFPHLFGFLDPKYLLLFLI